MVPENPDPSALTPKSIIYDEHDATTRSRSCHGPHIAWTLYIALALSQNPPTLSVRCAEWVNISGGGVPLQSELQT